MDDVIYHTIFSYHRASGQSQAHRRYGQKNFSRWRYQLDDRQLQCLVEFIRIRHREAKSAVYDLLVLLMTLHAVITSIGLVSLNNWTFQFQKKNFYGDFVSLSTNQRSASYNLSHDRTQDWCCFSEKHWLHCVCGTV